MGFFAGLSLGAGITAGALLIGQNAPDFAAGWIEKNLGLSIWFFAAVSAIFASQLFQLRRALKLQHADHTTISRLDQLTDVWTQVFVGIGVIWTAIGMRNALQYALGDSDAALAESADHVLRKLVDGGILLALSTTILGAIGGYVMRLIKTAGIGAELHDHYRRLEQQDLKALLHATNRIEQELSQRREVSSGV